VPSPRRASQAKVFSGRIDGGARGNPGPAGIGVLLEDGEGRRDEFYGYLGSATNNVAEYTALLVLLHHAIRRGAKRLTIHSDSELLVKQMRGEYRVKNPRLQQLHAVAKRFISRIPEVSLRHVPREENRDADRLANQAMDKRQSSHPLPEEIVELLGAGFQESLSFGESR
jgi:ribonuclease HI